MQEKNEVLVKHHVSGSGGGHRTTWVEGPFFTLDEAESVYDRMELLAHEKFFKQ
jgi:hypothetical protein